MKHILFVLLFATAGNIVFAYAININGEWIVEDDVGESGITLTINDSRLPSPSSAQYTDALGNPYTADIFGRTQPAQPIPPQPGRSYAFTVISAGTFFDFTANGTKLTGSIIRGETEKPIFDGKINGNKITFNVNETVAGKTYSYSYIGELSNDSIQFEVRYGRNADDRFKFVARRITN